MESWPEKYLPSMYFILSFSYTIILFRIIFSCTKVYYNFEENILNT